MPTRTKLSVAVLAALLMPVFGGSSVFAESAADGETIGSGSFCNNGTIVIPADYAQDGQETDAANYSLTDIERLYGREAAVEASGWRESHNLLLSLAWICRRHRVSWSWEGHLSPTSREWEGSGHAMAWSNGGHNTAQTNQWINDGHSYIWTRDNHSTTVSENWENQEHEYSLTRSQQSQAIPNSAHSWFEFYYGEE